MENNKRADNLKDKEAGVVVSDAGAKEGKRMINNSKKTYLFIFVAALILGGALIPSRFAYTSSGSLEHRLFFLVKTTNGSVIKKNSYVMFPLTSKFINGGKPTAVIKQAACVAGEQLTVTTDKKYYCNGTFLGEAKETSLAGDKVDNFVYEGKVPDNFIFVAGKSKDSYDSRYCGFIRSSDVQAIAIPLL